MSVLVIETNEKVIRAAIVKKGINGHSLSSCIKIERENEYEILSVAELSQIKSRISNCPKNVVLISSSATLIEIFMDKNKLKKIRKSQLKDVLKWEIEPFITGSPIDMIAGYYIGKAKDKKSMEIPIWVSMISKSEYTDLKEIISNEGLKLKRLYPPDPCFARVAKDLYKKKDTTIIDIGEKETKLAVLSKGKIMGYRDIPISMQDISFHLENTSREDLKLFLNEALEQWEGTKERVIISGVGGLNDSIVDFVEKDIAENVEVFDIDIREAAASSDINGVEFAAVLGAGIRELSYTQEEKNIGLDDAIELSVLIRARMHIVPIVALTSIALIFVGHYAVMKYQIKSVEAQMAVLQVEKNAADAEMSRYENLKNEEASLKEKMEEEKDKLYFLEKRIRGRTNAIVTILRTIDENASLQMKVLEIHPTDIDKAFYISGGSNNIVYINNFILGIQNAQWCAYSKIGKITREVVKDAEDTDAMEIAEYTFDMSIVKVADSYEDDGNDAN